MPTVLFYREWVQHFHPRQQWMYAGVSKNMPQQPAVLTMHFTSTRPICETRAFLKWTRSCKYITTNHRAVALSLLYSLRDKDLILIAFYIQLRVCCAFRRLEPTEKVSDHTALLPFVVSHPYVGQRPFCATFLVPAAKWMKPSSITNRGMSTSI